MYRRLLDILQMLHINIYYDVLIFAVRVIYFEKWSGSCYGHVDDLLYRAHAGSLIDPCA